MTALGDTVHYVARGSLDGKYPPTCRAAIITEHQDAFRGERAVIDVERVGLAAINPTGVFFHALSNGGCTRGTGPGQFHDVSECPDG
jgi:hypothetical protein